MNESRNTNIILIISIPAVLMIAIKFALLIKSCNMEYSHICKQSLCKCVCKALILHRVNKGFKIFAIGFEANTVVKISGTSAGNRGEDLTDWTLVMGALVSHSSLLN